jgi:hypothetical protein
MRVYHFINKEYGMEDLKSRHLKIATINDLNDPFDLFAVNASDEIIRRSFQKIRKMLAEQHGLLCFSADWHNPVQWSHYAEKHRGLCLGFDIPDGHLSKVIYSRKLLEVDAQRILTNRQLDFETATKLLLTKYSHWRYENEVRAFVNLHVLVPERGMYFAEFSDSLRLAKVIVGAESALTRLEVNEALGDLASSVDVFKARLAFKSFKVVRQRMQELWA